MLPLAVPQSRVMVGVVAATRSMKPGPQQPEADRYTMMTSLDTSKSKGKGKDRGKLKDEGKKA